MTETVETDSPTPGSPAVMPADLSMVVLSVRDMPALRRYYRALGWREQAGATDMLTIFELGGVALTLHPQAGPIEPADSAPDHPTVTFVVKVGTPGQVDTACSSAVRAGARALSGPDDQPWGGRSGVVADPEGNRWELLWVPRPSPERSAATVTG